ncbi:MAG TPA: toxin-antitoxin system HicB family antitoxin [Candidatus Kapabacteria bacterium]|nr:toxin-antitoxin system HicB family antitoxin [Candidatus Kapabacteria bacterium]
MSVLSIRLPESLHEKAKELARREGISVNQFMASALAEKLTALLTEEYLNERAARGDRTAFKKVMSRVRDRQPDRGDEMPAVNMPAHQYAYGRVSEPTADTPARMDRKRLEGITSDLTNREMQICMLLLQHPDASATWLAQRMGIEAPTVASYVSRIRKKLGVEKGQSLKQFLEAH